MTDTPLIVTQKQQSSTSPRQVWLLRLLLALSLMFGSEVLLWTEVGRAWWLWIPLIAGYLALAALLLDFMVRFFVVETFGLLALCGIYSVSAGLVLNPAVALAGMPQTLVSRVMGAQFIGGIAGFLLFLALVRGAPRRIPLLVTSVVVGAAWGVWVRGYSLLPGLESAPASLGLLLALGGGALLILLLLRGVVPLPDDPTAVLLSPAAMVGCAAVVGALLVFWAFRLGTSLATVLTILSLLAFCIVIVWFQKRRKPGSLLTLPAKPVNWPVWIVASALLLSMGSAGYLLPPPTDPQQLNPLSVLLLIVTMIGLVWLPAVSIVLGVRAYRTHIRTGRPI